ncbi:transcriptional regulator [Auritidibacter ignavus]|uniref:transcriptional regulator n=1 Tax=Auritidibacter ignavus TaxID=678932 RepID=UPI002448D1A1|nr:transcriptional regulator [Auritidibacter ignavus]WGH82658.1 transcriptional regulator [Auritidibacter ignavus]WHS34387.1 transcriptional regulator [Auritidibacter ignavus]
MTQRSTAELLVLHALRLVGFADTGAVAEHAGTGHADALRILREAEREGWVQRVAFADLDGWSLTDSGRKENERLLAEELLVADPGGVVATAYREFLPLNGRLLLAITDWQINPTPEDKFAPNNHTDLAWDGRILDELATLNAELPQLTERLSACLTRFEGYERRFETALLRAQNGEPGWVDRTDIDSCHKVWFQLHEDLVATLGIDRGSEGQAFGPS